METVGRQSNFVTLDEIEHRQVAAPADIVYYTYLVDHSTGLFRFKSCLYMRATRFGMF